MSPKSTISDDAVALAGVRQFLSQPRYARTLRLLLLARVSGLHSAELKCEDDLSPFIAFKIQDEKESILQYKCDPAAFALLLVIILLGQSAFINYTGNNPFLKVFGKANEKAGIVFARLLLGAEADEQVGYRNSDRLDLRFGNLILSSGASKRGTPDWYGLALSRASALSDSLFPGTPEEKAGAAKAVLHLAMESVAEEREEFGGT